MDSKFSAQEIGPDEDHQIRRHVNAKHIKVLDTETSKWKRGISFVERQCPKIALFLNDVPHLRLQEGTYGFIWDKNLQPSDGRYEAGEHYCGTREPPRKSVHGTVSFYRDGMTGAKFAIKTLEENAHFHPNEIRVGLTIEHPNICSVYGIIIRAHRIHILLEHAGSPLNEERTWITQSPQRMLLAAKQSFQALEVLHLNGFVHCDIKPDNIMISKKCSDFTVKLIDFGSCQAVGAGLPEHAHTTLYYWSPEMWLSLDQKKQVICRFAMDVYAMALTFYFVQTSNHLIQMLNEKEVKNLMVENPDFILLIALPETIPTELRAVMRPCLAGCPEARWSAEQAVRQLTEDTLTSVENYKDKFERLYALLKSSPSEVSAKTVFGEQAPSFTRDQPEGVQYFVGNSKGPEKKEITPAKNRKSIAFTASKCGRSAKCKKTMKSIVKVKSPRNNSLERNVGNLYQPCSLLTKLEKTSTHANFEPSTDEKAYSCSILLKNLALQVQPSEKKKAIAEEIAGNRTVSPLEGIFTQCDMSKDSSMKSLNVKKNISTKKLSMETLKFSMVQCDQTEFLSSGKIIDKIQSKAKSEQGAKSVLHNNSKHIKTKGSPPELNIETRDAILESQKSSSNAQNVTQPFPEITDIRVHPPVHEVSDGLDTRENLNVGDDMDFVIDALGPTILTGNDDDILNNWVQMLEKDEATEKSSSVEAAIDVNLDQFRSEASVPAEEAMDTDESDSKVGMSSMKHQGISRKRMSYPLETHPIPEKTICPDRDQILPNFEEILR
ncbi:probable serine/threonine-protein kinase CA_C1728 [Physella acuta]|uniref:probable serine/threonine-protein kinase CA_C1728 n=1 Tax=Physella acuta TaxID=109671 RepID=UPI0027DB248D|nr:probable serine/threonine-protein kinase CA_C1728 [Physella acuta]XP_059152981.1 probable serine/threonine-protein kinase CA_C1728 [Physella acuta]